MASFDHLIIGGGIAGTSLAVALHHRGQKPLLIESDTRLGGKIETLVTNEATFEFGPNSLTTQSPEMLELIEMLELTSKILWPTPAAKKRYILKNGKIVRLPSSPPEILTTQALSFSGRLRLLREIFYVPRKPEGEEVVFDFFARHFGAEAAQYFADPFVSGVYAGDTKKLSLSAAFPTMAEAEATSGSLIRHLISKRKTAKATPQSFEMEGGLSTLFHAAQKKLGAAIHLGESVEYIHPQNNGFSIKTNRSDYETYHLYIAVPSGIASNLLREKFPEAARLLDTIEYAPVVVAHLRIAKSEKYLFDGFGLLIPSSENRRLLGVLWNSSTFPSLFPDTKHHYVTVFLGGVRHPELVGKSESDLHEILTAEMSQLFHLEVAPEIIRLKRHAGAIPQYNLGHQQKIQEIIKKLSSHPRLKLAGNYLEGVSVPSTVAQTFSMVSQFFAKT